MILAEHSLGALVYMGGTVILLVILWVVTAMCFLVVGIIAARRLRRDPPLAMMRGRTPVWLSLPLVLTMILGGAGVTLAAREFRPSIEQDPSFDPAYVAEPEMVLIHRVPASSVLTSPPVSGGGVNGNGTLLAWIEDSDPERKWFDNLVIYDLRQQKVLASTRLPLAKPPNQMSWISDHEFAAEEYLDGAPGEDSPTQLSIATGPGWEFETRGIRPFPINEPRPRCKTGFVSLDGKYCTGSEFYNHRAYHGSSQYDLLIHRDNKLIARLNGFSVQGWAWNGDLIVEHDGLYAIPRSYLDALGNKRARDSAIQEHRDFCSCPRGLSSAA